MSLTPNTVIVSETQESARTIHVVGVVHKVKGSSQSSLIWSMKDLSILFTLIRLIISAGLGGNSIIPNYPIQPVFRLNKRRR